MNKMELHANAPIDWVAPYNGETKSEDVPVANRVRVPAPCSFTWEESDISKSTAGRSESGKMYKEKIGSVVKVGLGWDNIDFSDVYTILNAFNSEYLWVRMIDPKKHPIRLDTTTNKWVETELPDYDPRHYKHADVFYVGDRSAPMYNASMGLWSNVSFSLIERTPHT